MKRNLVLSLIVVLLGIAIYIADLPIFKSAPDGAEQIVLLHGLGRSENSMFILENEFAGAGFEVYNIGYPSNDETPEALIARVSAAIDSCCLNNGRPVHMVGHSLGGLLIRAYLADRTPENLGRVVLIGTPNKGSELADIKDGIAGSVIEWAGPTALMLGTGPDDFPASLPPPDYPVGVIAGTRDAIVTNEWLPLPNDSMVSRESTKLEGMTDFLELDLTHWGLRNSVEVADATIRFLRQGRFPASTE